MKFHNTSLEAATNREAVVFVKTSTAGTTMSDCRGYRTVMIGGVLYFSFEHQSLGSDSVPVPDDALIALETDGTVAAFIDQQTDAGRRLLERRK